MKPNKIKITNEIEKLKSIKPKVPRVSIFGDNNWKAIEAQIDVLEKNLSDFTLYDMRDADALSDYELDAAIEVREWLDGLSDAKPSEDWASLVKKED